MNQRRVVGILQELAQAHARVGALQAELAEAVAEDKALKPRARKIVAPKNPPSKEAVDFVRRKLRTLGGERVTHGGSHVNGDHHG